MAQFLNQHELIFDFQKTETQFIHNFSTFKLMLLPSVRGSESLCDYVINVFLGEVIDIDMVVIHMKYCMF